LEGGPVMVLKLCTPIIDGLLSNLSEMVFVSNCVPGATVVIRSLERPNETLVKALINQPDGFLPLIAGITLVAGDRLVARQEDAFGHESPETQEQLAVKVGAAPSNAMGISPVDINGTLWQCGRYAYVRAAVPGSTVEVLRNGAVIGSAPANGGIARLALTSTLSAGVSVQVRQRLGAQHGPPTPRDVEKLPIDPAMPLPKPIIKGLNGPIRACDSTVRIEGVFEGSDVTLTRESGEAQTAGFDLSGLWFTLATPLALSNRQVTAKQDLPGCRDRTQGGDEAEAEVEPAVKQVPSVGTLCAGSVSVRVDNVAKGTEVRLTVGPDTYMTYASGEGYSRFDVEPLPVGTITVQCSLCGIDSDPLIVTVEPQPAQIDQPVIVPQLFKCQSSITLDKLKPNAIVQVFGRAPGTEEGPISGQFFAGNTTMKDIKVTTLIEGEEVWAVQWACTLVPKESTREVVLPAPTISDPVFAGPVTRIDREVTVKGTVRDARVEVFRKTAGEAWELIGWKDAKGATTTVGFNGLVGGLAVDQMLKVRQRYCGIQTPGRNTTKVLKPVPMQPEIRKPAYGLKVPAGTNVVLEWRDPAPATGVDADRKADKFKVEVRRNGTMIVDKTVTDTTLTVPETETSDFQTQYLWSVLPLNTTGAGKPASSMFATPAPPDPSITATQDKDKIKVTGKDFAKSHTVEINIKVEYQELVGSPNGSVAVNDNRTGKVETTSTASGTLDYTFSATDVLEPRLVLTGSGPGQSTQNVKAPPYPGATVTITATNKKPPPNKGSISTSKAAAFTWQI
jgi:hypothetical protein